MNIINISQEQIAEINKVLETTPQKKTDDVCWNKVALAAILVGVLVTLNLKTDFTEWLSERVMGAKVVIVINN